MPLSSLKLEDYWIFMPLVSFKLSFKPHIRTQIWHPKLHTGRTIKLYYTGKKKCLHMSKIRKKKKKNETEYCNWHVVCLQWKTTFFLSDTCSRNIIWSEWINLVYHSFFVCAFFVGKGVEQERILFLISFLPHHLT